MNRCKASTKSGKQCLNFTKSGDYCAVHKNHSALSNLLTIGAGALSAVAFLPTLGAAVVGGTGAYAVKTLLGDKAAQKKRIFVSFDFDNDRALKNFIIGQSRHSDSPFDVIDHSLKEAAPERGWEKKANAAILRAEIVLVMVGPKTYRAQGVLKEVAMARNAGIKIVQIIGYKNGSCTSVPNAGRLYAWNWNNLKKLLS